MPSAIQPIAMKIAMTKSEALGRKRQITPATIESTPSPIETGLSQPGSLGRSRLTGRRTAPAAMSCRPKMIATTRRVASGQTRTITPRTTDRMPRATRGPDQPAGLVGVIAGFGTVLDMASS